MVVFAISKPGTVTTRIQKLCIERVLQNHQRIVQGADPSGNALEYVYALPNFKEVSVVIMLNDNSVRTVFAPGEPNNQLDYARCAAST